MSYADVATAASALNNLIVMGENTYKDSLALVYNRGGMYTQSYIVTKQLLKGKPANKGLLTLMLDNSTQLNLTNEAISYVDQLLLQDKNNPLYWYQKSLLVYNTKDYKTIFTKIPELKNGDRIYIKMKNKKITYTVKLGRELLTKEIDPYITYYPEGFNKSTVTLMTCTPPGSKTYLYIVVAELEKIVKLENN